MQEHGLSVKLEKRGNLSVSYWGDTKTIEAMVDIKSELKKALKKQPIFFRIGTKYMALIYQPLINNKGRIILTSWNKTTLIDDYGKKVLDAVPKFDDYSETDSSPRAENSFYYSDFHKSKQYIPSRKTPKEIYVLDDVEKFCQQVNIEYIIENQHN